MSTTCDFYSSLYSAVPIPEQALDDFFEGIPEQSLAPDLEAKLIAPIIIEEIRLALSYSPHQQVSWL